MPHYVNHPSPSNWGRWGKDDTLGTLNLIDNEARIRGNQTVITGTAIPLSLDLSLPGGNSLNPNRLPPTVRPISRGNDSGFLYNPASRNPQWEGILNDDLVVLHSQYSTQWDALSHVGVWFDVHDTGQLIQTFYNGFTSSDMSGPSSVNDTGMQSLPGPSNLHTGPLGIHAMAATGIQSRGVMIDLVKHYGHHRQTIGWDHIAQVMAKEKIRISSGDIIVFHTGFIDSTIRSTEGLDAENATQFGLVLDGEDQQLLNWLFTSNIAAIAADNEAIEAYPSASAVRGTSSSILPLHEHCLFKLGMPLGELWDLSPLAAALDNLNTPYFNLYAQPLHIPGACGSPVSPIAII